MNMKTYNNVTFNAHDLERLIILYSKAVEEKQDTFKYNENEYYTPYAKYLIEYLASEFKKNE